VEISKMSEDQINNWNSLLKKNKKGAFLGRIVGPGGRIAYSRKGNDLILQNRIYISFIVIILSALFFFYITSFSKYSDLIFERTVRIITTIIVVFCAFWQLVRRRKIFCDRRSSELYFQWGIVPFLKENIFRTNSLKVHYTKEQYSKFDGLLKGNHIIYLISGEFPNSKILVVRSSKKEWLNPILDFFNETLGKDKVIDDTLNNEVTKN
jgi:hypothetical protein